jgi:hypothetical protein
LPEGATYVVTTIGMLALPGVQKPIGFARREQIRLSDCAGEGSTRACDLTHTITNYEAELPAGKALQNGEKPVLELESRHRIDATGARVGTTSVSSNAEATATSEARALADAHLFYCLRLPAEPVGVGAVWTDECRMRSGGQVVTKQARWQLEKLDTDPEGGGRRAEIHMQATYVAADPDGQARTGVSRAVLYLWADAGEPHLYRELIDVPLAGGLATKTSHYFQFAKQDAENPDALVRTDGKPFSGFRTLNEMEKEPAGEAGSRPRHPLPSAPEAAE